MKKINQSIEGGKIDSISFEELNKNFPNLKLENSSNGLTKTIVAVLNIGQSEKKNKIKKCDVPVLRLEFEPENENFSVKIKIENGQNINVVNINKNLNQDELLKTIEQLNNYTETQDDPKNTFNNITNNLIEKLKTDFNLEINLTTLEREEYLPYDKNAEVNEDNLKDLEWLIAQHGSRIEKPVDQGVEKLFILNIGGEEFEFLESGDMYFVLNNIPTINVMEAAIKEGIMTEEDMDNYLSLQEEVKAIEAGKEKYKEDGERVGEEKNYRDNNYWKTAKANYKYDAVRELNYLEIGGEPVMDEFERDYIQLLGANVSRYDSAVLEVGFGMGISANAVQEKLLEISKASEKRGEVCTHIIIEMNHEVAEKAREWAKRQKIPVLILEGDWKEEIKNIPDGILTASLADPYPLDAEEKYEDAARTLQEIYKKLRPGGVASYYPDSQYCLSKRHAELAEEAGFDWIGSITSKFAQETKNTGEYYDPRLKMAIPVLYKTGGTGSSEKERLPMSKEEKDKIIRRLFIENPREAREVLLQKDYFSK